MPVRLDPFQNIVGVNWGGRLAPICRFTMLAENYDQERLMMSLDMVTPEASGQIGGIDETEAVTGFGSMFDGEFYNIQTTLFQEGAGVLKPDGRLSSFREAFVLPTQIDGGNPEIATLRIFLRTVDTSLPTVAAVIGTFGFGSKLVQPDAYWFKLPEGLLWAWTPLTDPLPESITLTSAKAQRERNFAFWGQRAFIRTVPMLGQVSDFGTLRLNFRTGDAEMLPPSTDPEEP